MRTIDVSALFDEESKDTQSVSTACNSNRSARASTNYVSINVPCMSNCSRFDDDYSSNFEDIEAEGQRPSRYMTAAEFESRVCNKLNSIRTSYQKTAQRYEAAIE